MAEGFFRKYAPRGYSTISVGTRPAGEINPIAIQVMKEVGIDISKHNTVIVLHSLTSIQNSMVYGIGYFCMYGCTCY
jgi:protein-tyrosine-phosphatase